MNNNNMVSFNRGPNGQFSPQVPTPKPGASTGEGAALMAAGAAVAALLYAGGSWLYDKFTKKDE